MTIYNIICISTIVLLLMFLLYYIHSNIAHTTEGFSSSLRAEWNQVSMPQLNVMPSNMLSPIQLYGIDGKYPTLGNVPSWFDQQDLTTAMDGASSNKDLAAQIVIYGQDSDYAKQNTDYYLSELAQKQAYYRQEQQQEREEYELQMSAKQREKDIRSRNITKFTTDTKFSEDSNRGAKHRGVPALTQLNLASSSLTMPSSTDITDFKQIGISSPPQPHPPLFLDAGSGVTFNSTSSNELQDHPEPPASLLTVDSPEPTTPTSSRAQQWLLDRMPQFYQSQQSQDSDDDKQQQGEAHIQ